jgi:acetylornithine deacetylase
VDPVAPVALARQLIDIDSTTGREAEVAAVLARYLRERGYSVLEQPLENGRTNVIAAAGEPRLVFSTHFDCVPPFFPSREEQGVLYGRGAADAKGILAAQIAAAERLRASGETSIGLVFVAGEERGSDGAIAANRVASQSEFLINGEPTDNRLGAATRGVYRVRLRATGRAAHSGYPELGESAIDKLIDALARMRARSWPADDVLGTTHFTVGLIKGGVAPNVVSPEADAEIIFRSVGDHGVLRRQLHETVDDLVTIEEVLEVPPVRLRTIDGFDTAVFAYTTDIPFLTRWGTPLLLGPGSIHVAHTDREHVQIAELETALSHHERWDGAGYPGHLAGEDIPLAARIVAVADAFDALTNDRPYRPARSLTESLAEIRRHRGRQFDPRIVDLVDERLVTQMKHTA